MKKIKLLLLPLFMVFLLSGCGENAIEKSKNKMDSLDNYKMNMKMDISLKMNNNEINMPIKFVSNIDQKNKTSYSKITTSVLGIENTSETYVDTSSNEKIISYAKNGNIWTKNEIDGKDEITLLNMQKLIEKGTNIKDMKSTDKNMLYYQMTVDKETFENAITKFGSGTNSFDVTNDVVVDLYIEKDTYYIKKMYADLGQVMKANNKNYSITKYTMEIIFSNYNKAGIVTIPSEAKKA